jgi:hypothetical protein
MVYPIEGPNKVGDTKNHSSLERLFMALVIERKEEWNEGYPRNEKEVYCGVTKDEKNP